MITRDIKEICEALQVIKDVCANADGCDNCPFGTESGDCLIEENPNNWTIKERKVVRALV